MLNLNIKISILEHNQKFISILILSISEKPGEGTEILTKINKSFFFAKYPHSSRWQRNVGLRQWSLAVSRPPMGEHTTGSVAGVHLH